MPLTDAEILTEIYNNCDPMQPATERFYISCTDVRGGNAFIHNLCKELSDSRGRIHQLFAGHIGGGKSSELQHFADKMNARVPLPNQKRFFTVVVNMLEYLEEYNVTLDFILLATVAELATVLRENKIGDLTKGKLPQFIENIKTILETPIQLSTVQTGIDPLKLTFTSLRTSPTAREKVTAAVSGNERVLREEVNTLFAKARLLIKNAILPEGEHSYTDFVLILDGLDRIRRFEGYNEGSESHRALFVEGFATLTGLDASVIYTAPLSLVRSEGNNLSNLYARDPYVLPMLKTEYRGKDHSPYEPGYEKLMLLLARRLPAGVTLGDVVADDALRALIYYSGGHVRSLLRFMREAALHANDTLPISLRAAQRAIASNVGTLNGELDSDDWELLAKFEREGMEEWDNNNEHQKNLLEHLYVYEYVNGGNDDFLNSAAQWYAVNPIVRGLNPFKRALGRLKNPI